MEDDDLNRLRVKALQSLRRAGQNVASSSLSIVSPDNINAEGGEENEAFKSNLHPAHQLASALASSDDFSNLTNLLRWIPEKSQYQVLATKPNVLYKIREELYPLLQSGVLDFGNLKVLGLSEDLLLSFRKDFPEFDNQVAGKKRKSTELEDDDRDRRFVLELSEGDEDSEEPGPHGFAGLEMGTDLESFVKMLLNQSLEQRVLEITMNLAEKQTRHQIIVDTLQKRQEQIVVLKKEKSLLENRRNISTARILKYSELMAAYRHQINQILAQISDLEKTRLQLQSNVDRSDLEAKACILSQEGDEAKILDIEKKMAEYASEVDSQNREKDEIQEYLSNDGQDITKLRRLLDSNNWEGDASQSKVSISQLVDGLLDLDPRGSLQPLDECLNVAFLDEYSSGFVHAETDLLSFRDVWNLPARDLWKDKVLSFCLERRRNMRICHLETMNGTCTNEKCQDLHFADLQMPGDQFSLKFALQSLDAHEKSAIKDQVGLISANSVDEYLTAFLKIPIVQAKLESMMGNDAGHGVLFEPLKLLKRHCFSTPALCEWASGNLDFSKYPKMDESVTLNGVDMWISKAISVLPASPDCLDSLPDLLKESILVCLDGLQFEENAQSEHLRSFFLDLLQAFSSSAVLIRELFDSAINDLPNSLHLCWMYYLYEKDAFLKKKLLVKIMEQAIKGQNSLALLNCLVQQLCKPASFSNLGAEEKALLIRDYVDIITGTFAKNVLGSSYSATSFQSVLSIDHYTIFVLLLISSLVMPTLTQKVLFLSPPHSNICIPKLFLIPWESSVLGSETIIAIDTLLRLALETVDAKRESCLASLPSNSSGIPFLYRSSIIALARNRLELLHHCAKIQPKALASIAHHYYSSKYPFDEFLDVKAKYLQLAGFVSEATNVFKKTMTLTNGEFSLLVHQVYESLSENQDKDARDQQLQSLLSDKCSSLVFTKKLETAKQRPHLFSTNLEAVALAAQKKDLKSGMEIILKELVHLKAERSASKLFLWSELLFSQVCCRDKESAILESCKRMVSALPHLPYPFSSDDSVSSFRSQSLHSDALVVPPVSSWLLNWDVLMAVKNAVSPDLAKSMEVLLG